MVASQCMTGSSDIALSMNGFRSLLAPDRSMRSSTAKQWKKYIDLVRCLIVSWIHSNVNIVPYNLKSMP